ncbi:hypothetical protein RND71_043830 [Anisodus tanguticus]|uniref:Uncharacterized protein n=1 Tax=Anisodus tanguticus TaxID=243964 RepID=A0AAE1QRR4_9SOLA|nr:hypothetical protein RND71_044206 [Anisodus tanguticus]KAK4337503.1 hypothetical protein RND71_043830 [Anisodus tanguticus]
MEKERMHLQPLSHIHLPRHDIDSRQSALLQPVTAIDWGESASLTAGTDRQAGHRWHKILLCLSNSSQIAAITRNSHMRNTCKSRLKDKEGKSKRKESLSRSSSQRSKSSKAKSGLRHSA